MPSELHDAQSYSFQGQEEVILDANIWLYLQGPLAGVQQSLLDIYSNVLDRILLKKCGLVISPFILSEFANRYARMEQKVSTHWNLNFKNYRQMDAFKPVLEDITRACQNITGMCTRSTRYTPDVSALQTVLTEIANKNLDFNDALLAWVCRRENLILVTHDGDFADLDGLTVVTANRGALKR